MGFRTFHLFYQLSGGMAQDLRPPQRAACGEAQVLRGLQDAGLFQGAKEHPKAQEKIEKPFKKMMKMLKDAGKENENDTNSIV